MALSTPPPPPDPPSTVTTTGIAAASSVASTTTALVPLTTTTASTSAATPPRPVFPPNPRPPPPHPHPGSSHPFQAPFFSNHPHSNPPANSRLSSNPNPNYSHIVSTTHSHDVGATTTSTPSPAVMYPVASSGRGFLKQTPANSNPSSSLYQSRPGLSYPRPPFGYSHSDLCLPPQGMGFVTGRQTQAALAGNTAGVMPGVIKGVPVTGASSQSQHKVC